MMCRILVALDDSPLAPHVLQRAVDIARPVGASLRLYHAVAIPPEFPPSAVTQTGDPLPAYLHRQATERLTSLMSRLSGVHCDILVEESHRTALAIVDAAVVYDADLIVMGSHGYNLLDRVLGTTAAKVVNTSPRDILVVHRATRH